MRSLKELYTILLSEVEKKANLTNYFGICEVISEASRSEIISKVEHTKLYYDFIKRRPKYTNWWLFDRGKFPKTKYLTPNSVFWWEHTYEGSKQRILFIKYIINKL